MAISRILSIVCALLVLLCSCQKDNSTTSGDKLLRRVASDSDSLMSSTFVYDGQNRLTKLVDSIRYGHQWETTIAYNGAGHPEKLTTLYRAPSNTVDFAVVDSLVYENGKVTKKYQRWPYSPQPTAVFLTHQYVYDAMGRLVTDFGGQTVSFDNPASYVNFSYDANDNIVKIVEYNRASGALALADSTTIAYNSTLNPYNTTGLILYFAKGDNLLVGKHNKTSVIRQKPNAEPLNIDYRYEQDSNGLLNRMVINRSQRGTSDSTSVFQFYYQ